MKSKKMGIVRYLFGEDLCNSNNEMILHGDKKVEFVRKKSKRYKQYF